MRTTMTYGEFRTALGLSRPRKVADRESVVAIYVGIAGHAAARVGADGKETAVDLQEAEALRAAWPIGDHR